MSKECRLWTKEEITFLEESWGYKSVKTIAKMLNRSENAVLIKKDKLGLGAFLENGDYITFKQLLGTLGYCETGSWIEKSWIENRGFSIKYKRVNKNRFKVVNLNDFWKWAEKNQSFLDFSKFERYALGKEPKWVEAKRQRDIINNANYKKSKWTQSEDERLIFLVNQYKYTYQEISKMMQRTENAIGHRLAELNIKARPIKKDSHLTKWTKKETEELKRLIKDGYDFETMQNVLINKSVRSIRSKIYRMYGTERLDKVRNNIDNLKENNYSCRKKWTDEERQVIEDMLWEGWSYKDIQKKFTA